MGDWAMRNLERGGFDGSIYPVNPGRSEIGGRRSFPSVAACPSVPDLAIFAVGDARIEAALDDALAAGVRAVVIMSALVLDDDDSGETGQPLQQRIRGRLRAAGIPACGANGMGFYNVRDRVWACGFDSRMHRPPGSVTYISHSGSGLCGIVDSEARLAFNLAVSTGNELAATMDEYLDFALDLPETRVVGLFVETARNPAGFEAALARAAENRVPVAALKVGRTRRAAELTVSHSGAMAGDDATYDALFDRYGVVRVDDMAQLATTLLAFSSLHPLPDGGLVSLHDSGGERQLMVDLADRIGVALPDLAPATVEALEGIVDPELPAVNPLDAWSRGGAAAGEKMAAAFATLLADPGAALGAVVHDRGPDSLVYAGYRNYLERGRSATGKPVALVSAWAGSGFDPASSDWYSDGLPVFDDVGRFLVAVRGLMSVRDFASRPASSLPDVDIDVDIDAVMRRRLAAGDVLDEAASLQLLAAAGIDTPRMARADGVDAALAAAAAIGYPVVIKTAATGVHHKTESDGVSVGIADATALRAAAEDLVARCGPGLLVAEHIDDGVEMILGARRDPQFGPVVMLGFGGVHAEVLRDVAFAMPPLGAADAARLTGGLRLAALLEGARGSPAAAVAAYCDAAARFSVLVAGLGDALAEFDVNPLIVTPTRCVAVDGLAAGHAAAERDEENP